MKVLFAALGVCLLLSSCNTVQSRTAHPEQSYQEERTIACQQTVGFMPLQRPAYQMVRTRDGRRVLVPVSPPFGAWGSYSWPHYSSGYGYPVWSGNSGISPAMCDVDVAGRVVCRGTQKALVQITPVTVVRQQGQIEKREDIKIIEARSSCR